MTTMYHRTNRPAQVRVFDKLDTSGGADACWTWTGATAPGGYGQVGVDGRNQRVHRLVFEWSTGQAPGDLCVCHSCDNPPCANPRHLFLGTHRDNTNDKVAKGRQQGAAGDRNGRRTQPWRTARGSGVGSAKLTDEQVLEIRERFAAGEGSPSLGAEFGLADRTVHALVTGATWTHVGGPITNDRDRRVGSRNKAAKLDEHAVASIKAALAAGETATTLAAAHGVSLSAVSLIDRGKTWRHVEARS